MHIDRIDHQTLHLTLQGFKDRLSLNEHHTMLYTYTNNHFKQLHVEKFGFAAIYGTPEAARDALLAIDTAAAELLEHTEPKRLQLFPQYRRHLILDFLFKGREHHFLGNPLLTVDIDNEQSLALAWTLMDVITPAVITALATIDDKDRPDAIRQLVHVVSERTEQTRLQDEANREKAELNRKALVSKKILDVYFQENPTPDLD